MTALFYTAATTPTLCEWAQLPLLKPEEAQAWSALVLSTGLVYRTFVSRPQKQHEATPIEEEKKDK